MAEQKQKKTESKKKNLVRTPSTRGRIFQGLVTKKFPKRVVIEFQRTIYIPKYERYTKKKTRLHARVPDNIEVNIGDLIKVQETRPFSKIIHFLVIEIIKASDKTLSDQLSTKAKPKKHPKSKSKRKKSK